MAIQNRFERKITRLSRRFLPHSARKVLRNILPRKVREDLWWNLADVTLVSFPKSGRTWLRLMIGRVLQQHFGTELDDSLLELERLADRDSRIPRIHAAHDGVGSWRDPREYRGRRVILLVRDPRDVVVSYYYQLRYRMDQFDGTLDEFVTDPARIGTILRFYDTWASGAQNTSETLVVRYEDLHENPQLWLARVMEFIGIDGLRDETIAEAVEFARFDNMRRYEEAGTFGKDRLRPGSSVEPASFKTRQGKVGSYRTELTPDVVEQLDKAVADSRASVFGYS